MILSAILFSWKHVSPYLVTILGMQAAQLILPAQLNTQIFFFFFFFGCALSHSSDDHPFLWQQQIHVSSLLDSLLSATLLSWKTHISTYLFTRHTRRSFIFMKKDEVKIGFSICFAANSMRQKAPWAVRVVQPSSFPKNHTQHQAARALNCVFEHLRLVSIYSVHPSARRVPR